MASVEERVKQIIVEQLGVDEGEVTASASFVDDLGADSLDTVELVMAHVPKEKHVAEARRINRVHRALSRPLTILGAERKLFFFAMCIGAATFNLLNSLFGGLLMFLLLYVMARWPTETDPQILRFLLTAARLRAQYDPMKFSPIRIRRDTHAQA